MAAQPLKQRPGKSSDKSDKSLSMTGSQGKQLKALAREGREPEAYDRKLSAEGAETRIRVLQAKIANDKSGKQHKPD